MQELGPINFTSMSGAMWRFVPSSRRHDDDVSGTLPFRAHWADHGFPKHLTSQQIGNTWLNYIVESDRSCGGAGSAFHRTYAYLRLKSACRRASGSIA